MKVSGLHLGSWRRAFLTLSLLALLVQALAVQTHIHLPWLERQGALEEMAGGKDRPDHGDAAHCPLWLQLVHAGTFTLAGVASHLPPFLTWQAVEQGAAPSWAVVALSHSWQGRAPPVV